MVGYKVVGAHPILIDASPPLTIADPPASIARSSRPFNRVYQVFLLGWKKIP